MVPIINYPKITSKNYTMTIKRLLRLATLVLFMTVSLAASSSSLIPDRVTVPDSASKTEDIRTQQLVHRLEEIKSVDRSEMTRSERKALRKEVKAIKKELKAANNGVYLSVGAVIIIILLLILLL